MKSRAIANDIMLDGHETPLDVMIKVMREATNAEDKLKAAIAAAPYVHPRLAAVEHSGNQDKPLSISVVSGVIREDADEHVNGDTHASH